MSVVAVALSVVAVAALALVALLVALRVLIFFVALYEVRPVRYLVPAAPDDPERAKLSPVAPGEPSGPEGEFNPYEGPRGVEYAAGQNQAAGALGFACHGLFAHAKQKYHVRAALWFSPDRRTLAVVLWGTVLKLSANKTVLYSRLRDGRVYVTSDTLPGNDTPKPHEVVVVQRALLDALLRRHERRLAGAPCPIVPFDEADPFEDYQAIMDRRHESLVDRREEYYVDPDRSAVRSTVRGALRMFLRSWKVPGYVERIETPGAEPVPVFRRKKSGPEALRYADWFFTAFIALIVAWAYARPVRSPREDLLILGGMAVGFAGIVVVGLVRTALKFRDRQ